MSADVSLVTNPLHVVDEWATVWPRLVPLAVQRDDVHLPRPIEIVQGSREQMHSIVH